ncbi:MAG: hypothetical protein WC722_05000 [Rhodospirillales bacterium]
MQACKDIICLTRKICSICVEAICNYERVSGELGDVPEYYMASRVFDRLGEEHPMTLETNSSQLWEWNKAQIGRTGTGGTTSGNDYDKFKETVGTARCDLVIYKLTCPTDERNKANFLALVEFKKWERSESDVRKTEVLLKDITCCPYGICVGFVDNGWEGYLDKMRDAARQRRHRFIRGKEMASPLNILNGPRKYQAFAEIICNNNHPYFHYKPTTI